LEIHFKIISPSTPVGDNIKIDLRETELGGIDWIHMVQDKEE
jgi:hypothetical protein